MLDRGFHAEGLNQRWIVETYGRPRLSVGRRNLRFLRRLAGWAMTAEFTAQLITGAL